VLQVDLFLAQAFFGVRERAAKTDFKQMRIVPPLISRDVESRASAERKDLHAVLVNLGGLKNPMLTDSVRPTLVARNALSSCWSRNASNTRDCSSRR